MSRAYTPEEVRDKILCRIKNLVKYWATVEGPDSVIERLDGLAFSILTTLDGASIDLPAMNLVPAPHTDDKQYQIEHGENWFEPVVINDCCQLHKYYVQLEPKY